MTDAGPDSRFDDALAGVRILEWGRGIAAGYAARLLADFGAEVTRIPPARAGDPRRDSFAEVAALLDHGKTHVAIDPSTVEGRAELLERLSTTDLLIEDYTPRERSMLQLDREDVARAVPRLVQVSITPFGQSGPYRDFRAGDLEIAYLSGLAHLTPRDIPADDATRWPPLKMPGSLVSIYAGASAAAAALTALYGHADGHDGRLVDVSMLESLIPTLRREIALFQYEGRVASRFMRVWRLAPWGVKPCRDGYVFLQVVERHHWEGLVDMMGAPEWARDPRYLDPDLRFEHRVDIEARMAPWLSTQSKAQFAWEAQRRGLPFAPINELADLVRIPQLHFRRFFHSVSMPDRCPCVMPGAPFAFASTRPSTLPKRQGLPRRRPPGIARKGPLRNLRVIDFGHVWAGPYCAALFADMGAEVIKVESAHRLDIHRRQGPYADGKAGINRSGVWNAQNRGKRSVTLNLSTERGRGLAKALVATADVVIENFAPGVMKRLGLDYASLCACKPDLIMASLSAFGQDGPQRSYVGYGPSLDAWAGLDSLTAYPGGEPGALGGIFPDTGSALHAGAAILAALLRRDRTGAGCYIDVSELEVSILLLSDLVARELGGAAVGASGNADGDCFPQGAFPCAGADRWIALSVTDPSSWIGLCTLLGRTDWGRDAHLGLAAGRRAIAIEIEAAITAWTSGRSPQDAMLELQSRGVPAGVAHDAETLLADPHLAKRGFFRPIVHPEAGVLQVYAPIWRVDGAKDAFDTPAPLLGADNEYVLGSLLGLRPTEIGSLIAEQIVH